MPSAVPDKPKLYHIVHIDRLASIVADGHLWSDAEAIRRASPGTTVGMGHIKERRLKQNQLASHPGLYVGQCVPFYFCPRSVMLYMFWKGDSSELAYRGGQEPIVHLVFDLRSVVKGAKKVGKRWAFTLSNAGSSFFEDRAKLSQLDEIDWDAIRARYWADCRDRKQAEFLVKDEVPWEQVIGIAVHSQSIAEQVSAVLATSDHQPPVKVLPGYYYS